MIALFADDLTGALDSAVPFAGRGLTVRVSANMDAIEDALQARPDVIVVNTESRDLPADQAGARIAAAWAVVAPSVPKIVMKKVDSRLKGRIGEETQALMAASRRTEAVICPALPEQGRLVHAGCASGRGISDPIDIAAAFGPVAHAPIRDAATPGDIASIAGEILADPGRKLAVGARGLAIALAEALGARSPSTAPALQLPLLIAVGSRDPISAIQVQRLLAQGLIDAEIGLPDGGVSADRTSTLPISLIRATEGGERTDPAAVAERLASRVAAYGPTLDARSLLVVGGDTAAAIVRAIGGGVLTPLYELAPGVPAAALDGQPDLVLATKSGGFGEPETLAEIARHALAAHAKVAA